MLNLLSWAVAIVVFISLAIWLDRFVKLRFPNLTFTHELLIAVALLLLLNIATSRWGAPGRFQMVGPTLPYVALDTSTGRLCAVFDAKKLESAKKSGDSDLETAALFPPCGK